ncbi:MAG: ribonuclease R [Planctomycetota bacterium]|jgi:ribonuclease R
MPYTEAILKHLRRKKYTPLTSVELADKLNIGEDLREAFEATLQALEYQGRVARVKENHYSLPGRAGVVIGTLDVARGGFGFVVPLDRDRYRKDIHIPRGDLGTATEGDLVAARVISKRGRFGQPSGTIEYVVRRHRVNFVGTFEAGDGGGRVAVDGASSISEIAVPQFESVRAQSGEKVVVEVRSWRKAPGVPSGVIVEVLGAAEDPTTDTIAVIREFDLPMDFSDEALAEAERLGETVRPEDIEGRLDLRDRTVVTIDPVHARDFDDAISIKRTADGWLLGVHIADVSAYAPAGSVIDAEAAGRGTSVYLPTKVIPMIPHSISNGIASLRENEDRLTKTVILRYNRRGQLLGYEIHRSVIRSAKRLTYDQASEIMTGRTPKGITLTKDMRKLLRETAELAQILERRRLEAGMLELDMPEVELELDGAGEVTDIKPAKHDASHKLIEMFMVAANEAIAEFMTTRGLPHIRRAHEGPSSEDLQALKAFLSGMGFVIRDVDDRNQLQDILRRAEGRVEAPIINLAVLKSMKQAIYTQELKGHFALASDQYLHYTSPIRRYPDLVVHQVLNDYLTGALDGERKAWWRARMPQTALECSQLARRAEGAERELTKLKVLRYLEKHAEGEFEGLVTGVKPYGIFVELRDYLVDGFVHVSGIPGGPLRFDARKRRLLAKKRGSSVGLGDAVLVAVKSIDLASRRLDLELLEKIRR